MKFKAVLFDMDGVLVDSCKWHFDSLKSALQEFGFDLDYDEFTSLEGIPTIDKIKSFSNRKNIPQELFAVINEKKQEYMKLNLDTCCTINQEKIFLFQKLKDLGLKIACCSSSKKDSVMKILSKLGLIDYFDLILSSDDVILHKPDPYVYLKAMENLGLGNEDCIIVEDSDAGVQAAISAGGYLIKVDNSSQVVRGLFESILED